MPEHAPAKEDSATQSGLPWPETYLDLLPVMQQEWGIENAIKFRVTVWTLRSPSARPVPKASGVDISSDAHD